MTDTAVLDMWMARVVSFAEELKRQGIHVGINGTCAACEQAWPCRHTTGAEIVRAHARRTDPWTSDKVVRSIASDTSLMSLIWRIANQFRREGRPFNDTLLTEVMWQHHRLKHQRNVVARARGIMEDQGFFRQAGVQSFRGRPLMHYEIDPNNAWEKEPR